MGSDIGDVTVAIHAILSDPNTWFRGGLAVIRRGRIRLRQLPSP